jgi:hypothetical protein
MKKFLLFMSILLCTHLLYAQQNFWRQVNESSVNKDLFVNRYKPTTYQLFHLDAGSFNFQMRSAPSERNVSSSNSGFIISIPNSDGVIERYRVVDAPVMDPALAAKYPEIKSYAGKGIENAGSTIRFDISPQGFHGMILSADRTTIYIDPVDIADNYYVVFARKDVVNYQNTFQCTTNAAAQQVAPSNGPSLRSADDGRLRTFRLALACTGEYSQFFLDGSETTDAQRKAKVLAAMNTAMVRTNGIYERDFGIRMNLIANNDAIIYLTASSDPWTNEYNTKTQQTIDAVIGNANYDIGHLFHRGSNNGNAGCIACVCKTGQKGSGFTSHTSPVGDPFVVDYSTHEMGHQFGANHTFTFSNESGTASQFEPGSGSTIMGYAGITGATDVQPHSDDYFHARSIEQVSDYIKSGTGGGACAVVTITGNTAPVANAGADYIIPKATPFSLTGTASDVDAGDVLTYTWEQMNAGTSATTNPSTTATTGPLFRSRTGSTNPSRTFPILSSILDGTNGNQWERLPGVARTLNFRLMIRDNHAGGGNTKDDDMAVTVNGTAGPFAVTAPNTAVSWAGNSAQTITWSVNSTNIAPVNCANVKISISTNGGTSFTTLVATTANDGSEVVTIPNTATTTARIKVEAVGNIFFDISNTNFTITSGSGCASPVGLASSAITTSSATVSWSPVSGALSYDVDYKTTASGTWINAATGTTNTSVNLTGLVQATTYDWRVRTNCSASSSAYATAQFTTSSPATCNPPTGLASSGVTSSAATVSWTGAGGAISYDADYKTNASSTWINAATATTATAVNLTGLSASTLYDWRVRTNCASLTSGYATAQFTTGTTSTCGTAFEPNETLATAATISAGVANSAAVTTSTDNDYFKIVTTATSNNTFTLAGPSGVDFDMTIYNSGGTQIGSGASATANETVSLTNQAAGTYYIRVFGYNGANSATCYTITATVSTVTGCASSYDVSTNGSSGGAAQIPLNANITGLISPSGDNDYYSFVITTGGTATVTLTNLPADYDLRVYRSNGTSQVGISQNGGTSNETITRTYDPGTYYARVYGYQNANSATNCYTLRVTTGTASREDNMIVENKVSVFPNPASSYVTIKVDGLRGKADIRIFDIYGKMVMQQGSMNTITNLDIARLPAGVYTVKVKNASAENTVKIVKQ